MSVVLPAQTIHDLYREAEQSYERGQYPASVHDVYIHAYVEAIVQERHRVELEATA